MALAALLLAGILLWCHVNQAAKPEPTAAAGPRSVGDPDYITDLTYEEFQEFYRVHYHPSNSYIFLYGDMNIEEQLAFLNDEYLSHFDAIEVHT